MSISQLSTHIVEEVSSLVYLLIIMTAGGMICQQATEASMTLETCLGSFCKVTCCAMCLVCSTDVQHILLHICRTVVTVNQSSTAVGTALTAHPQQPLLCIPDRPTCAYRLLRTQSAFQVTCTSHKTALHVTCTSHKTRTGSLAKVSLQQWIRMKQCSHHTLARSKVHSVGPATGTAQATITVM